MFLFNVLAFSQEQVKDTVTLYYVKDEVLHKCLFDKRMASKETTFDFNKFCTNDRIVPKETEEFQKFFYYAKSYKLIPANHNENFVYDLPYGKGESYKVIQGNDGKFSHDNKNAIDFMMPEGTNILAVREGTVLRVVQNNNKGCGTKKCAKFANFVWILHDDGTIAGYYHLMQNSVFVKKGKRVKKGELIAYSGNTGWSTLPHLHLECFIPSEGKRITFKTFFRTGEGKRVEYLYEGESYPRNY